MKNRNLKSILLGLIIRIHDNIVLLCHDARIRKNVTLASSNKFEKHIFECSCPSQFSRCEICDVERCALNVGNCLH